MRLFRALQEPHLNDAKSSEAGCEWIFQNGSEDRIPGRWYIDVENTSWLGKVAYSMTFAVQTVRLAL